MSLPKCNISFFDPSRVIIVFHNLNITKTSISISRTVGEFSEQKQGVFEEYRKSLTKTIRELDELEMLPNGSHNRLKIKVKIGMDGAGHQLKIKGAEHPSMELFGYVVLEVFDMVRINWCMA